MKVYHWRFTFPQIGITFPEKKYYVSRKKYYISENQNITFPQIIASSVSQVIKVLPVVPCSPTRRWK
jgi:hypothetical protein